MIRKNLVQSIKNLVFSQRCPICKKISQDSSYICEEFPLLGGEQSRSWWNPGGFSEKWYLSAFPQNEINKGYGLVQNPGWE